MLESLLKVVDSFPFIGLAVNGSQAKTPFGTRLAEAAIIGIITGVIAMKGTVMVLDVELKQLKTQLGETKTELKAELAEIKQEQRQVRRDLYTPR